MSDRRILVVDDEPDMVENCTRLLRRAGHRVMGTTDPERALALLESERPDLLLTPPPAGAILSCVCRRLAVDAPG